QAVPAVNPPRQHREAAGDHAADRGDRRRRRRARGLRYGTQERRFAMSSAVAVKTHRHTGPVGVGRVARVTGPVVDIEFPHDSIPEIYNALKTTIVMGEECTELTLEVAT